jgi:hypothetical protein
MSESFRASEVVSGTFGSVWIDAIKFANVKKFEAKCTFKYEDVDVSEQLGTDRKFAGYEIKGTITLHKVDSSIVKKLADGIKEGNMPVFKVVARNADPSARGQERIELIDLTFDEATLLSFESKKLIEEEFPFQAVAFNYLDTI